MLIITIGGVIIDDIIDLIGLSRIKNKIDSFQLYDLNDKYVFEITLKRADIICDVCSATVGFKEYRLKKIKHSFHRGKPCVIHYKSRVYRCNGCRKIFLEENPFISTNKIISRETVFLVLEELKKHDRTYSAVAREFDLSVRSVLDIFDKNVNIKRKKLPTIMCVDEFYKGPHFEHKYAFSMLDLKTKELVDIVHSRRGEVLESYFSKIPKNERDSVRYIVIDMYDLYRRILKFYFVNAVIIIDLFHILNQVNKKMEYVKNSTVKRIKNIISIDKEILESEYFCAETLSVKKKSHEWWYVLFKHYGHLLVNLSQKEKEHIDKRNYYSKLNAYYSIRDLIDIMNSYDKRIKDSYYMKEEINEFLLCRRIYLQGDASILGSDSVASNKAFNEYLEYKEELLKYAEKIRQSGLFEFRDISTMFENWSDEIVFSFIRTNEYSYKRMTNGALEGRNKYIKKLKHDGNGFNNFKRFRNRAMYIKTIK